MKTRDACSSPANVVANSPLHRSKTTAPPDNCKRAPFILAGDRRDRFKV